MDLKYLNTFKTILESGSFLNASQKLNCTQSTVTFQVQQLEQELRVKLFEKVGRRMVATQAGKDMLPHIEAILRTMAQLKNYGKHISEMTGLLKIALPETIFTYKIHPVLKSFREQAPGIRLEIETLNCHDIREKILAGSIDVGVHYDVGGYGDSVITGDLAEFPVVLVGSPSLDAESCDFAAAKQRKRLCMITNDNNSVFHNMFERYLKDRDIIFEESMHLGSIEAVKRSVVSNLGMAYLPRHVVAEELAAGHLREISLDGPPALISCIYAHHKNKWVSPAMQLFIELLQQTLKPESGGAENLAAAS